MLTTVSDKPEIVADENLIGHIFACQNQDLEQRYNHAKRLALLIKAHQAVIRQPEAFSKRIKDIVRVSQQGARPDIILKDRSSPYRKLWP